MGTPTGVVVEFSSFDATRDVVSVYAPESPIKNCASLGTCLMCLGFPSPRQVSCRAVRHQEADPLLGTGGSKRGVPRGICGQASICLCWWSSGQHHGGDSSCCLRHRWKYPERGDSGSKRPPLWPQPWVENRPYLGQSLTSPQPRDSSPSSSSSVLMPPTSPSPSWCVLHVTHPLSCCD